MAGSYSDAAHRRMAYHIDGTVVVSWVTITETITEWNSTETANLNDENTDGSKSLVASANAQGSMVALIFPEHRDIYGYHLSVDVSHGSVGLQNIETSVDTTNGVDGTWTPVSPITGQVTTTGSVRLKYRTLLVTLDTPHIGVRAIRFQVSGGAAESFNPLMFHVYGEISAGETPDRLLVIDGDTSVEFDKVHDWGDVPRGVTLDKNFKLQNNSTGLTAVNTALTFAGLDGNSYLWHSLSDAGGAFSTALTIASIAPGALYPSGSTDYLRLRVVIGSTESLGDNVAWLSILPSTWT